VVDKPGEGSIGGLGKSGALGIGIGGGFGKLEPRLGGFIAPPETEGGVPNPGVLGKLGGADTVGVLGGCGLGRGMSGILTQLMSKLDLQ